MTTLASCSCTALDDIFQKSIQKKKSDGQRSTNSGTSPGGRTHRIPMLQQKYEPYKEGMEVPCAGRIARGSAMDSFDPRTWKGIERCLLVEHALNHAPKKKEGGLEYFFLTNRSLWMINLCEHRTYCSTCHHDKEMKQLWGFRYYNTKWGHRPLCFSPSVHFFKRRDYCYHCSPENWRLWRLQRLTNEDETDGLIHHGQIVVAQHFNTWMIRTFHLGCALKRGLIPEEMFIRNKKSLEHLKKTCKVRTAVYLREHPEELLNPAFFNCII